MEDDIKQLVNILDKLLDDVYDMTDVEYPEIEDLLNNIREKYNIKKES